jgi:type I restriction enzyme M protein
MPAFGKRTPFTRDYFRTPPDAPASQPRDKFEDVFGDDPRGGPAALAARQDTGVAGRWRRFTREQIAQRGDNLDIAWLKDSGSAAAAQQSESPARVAGLALRELTAAMTELRALLDELGEDPDALLDTLADEAVSAGQSDETQRESEGAATSGQPG